MWRYRCLRWLVLSFIRFRWENAWVHSGLRRRGRRGKGKKEQGWKEGKRGSLALQSRTLLEMWGLSNTLNTDRGLALIKFCFDNIKVLIQSMSELEWVKVPFPKAITQWLCRTLIQTQPNLNSVGCRVLGSKVSTGDTEFNLILYPIAYTMVTITNRKLCNHRRIAILFDHIWRSLSFQMT